jgi:hypothetical protein
MKGFERRQIKKSFTLPLLHLTSYIFLSVCLTFALCLVLCCAGTTSVCSFDNYIENMASRSTKTCCRTHFHAIVWTPPSLGLDSYTHTSNFVLKNVENR